MERIYKPDTLVKEGRITFSELGPFGEDSVWVECFVPAAGRMCYLQSALQ